MELDFLIYGKAMIMFRCGKRNSLVASAFASNLTIEFLIMSFGGCFAALATNLLVKVSVMGI